MMGLHFFLALPFALFLACFLIQCWHYLLHFTQACKTQSESTRAKRQKSVEGVSVIICARNEAHNLAQHIPSICQQDYPNFEVLVVNDRSTDQSDEVLQTLQTKYANLKVVEHQSEDATGKKAALRFGIQQAQNELLLLTDADCVPESNQWIASMIAGFDEKTDLVLGISPYEKEKGLLNQFVQYETYLTAIQYLSWAAKGKSYMGVGRNLAYRKSAFLKTDQFENTLELASGDDDLMVQQITKAQNTKTVCTSAASTVSKAPQSFKQWWKQKTRHLSTGTVYPAQVQKRLGAFTGSLVFFYLFGLATILLAISQGNVALALTVAVLFLLRWLFMITCNARIPKPLQLRNAALAIPFYDLLYFCYLVVFAPFLIYKPKANSWNKQWIDSYT